MLKLYTTVSSTRDYVGLNQYIDYWHELGMVERVNLPYHDSRFCSWLGKETEAKLMLEPSDPRYSTMPFEYCLCSQYREAIHGSNERILPWNFFVRDWATYEDVMEEPDVPRTCKSIFSGTIRGDKHSRLIFKDSTEIWSATYARNYNKTNHRFPNMKEYYRQLKRTQFGLALGGDGGDKSCCQREWEYMGLGCIPIFDPHVEHITYDSPIYGIHFYKASTPEEMNEIINTMPESVRHEIIFNITTYFERYISPTGLWQTVLNTIDERNIKV